MTIQDALAAIGDADQSDLDLLVTALNARRKALHAQAEIESASTLKPGDRVRLSDLSPRYLNGLTAVVKQRSPGSGRVKFVVEFENEFAAGPRFGSTVTVPASCLQACED